MRQEVKGITILQNVDKALSESPGVSGQPVYDLLATVRKDVQAAIDELDERLRQRVIDGEIAASGICNEMLGEYRNSLQKCNYGAVMRRDEDYECSN